MISYIRRAGHIYAFRFYIFFFFYTRKDDEITHLVDAIENFSSVRIFHPFATHTKHSIL